MSSYIVDDLPHEEGQRGERGVSQSDLYRVVGRRLGSMIVVSKFPADL